MRECEGFIKVVGAASGEDMVKTNIQRQLASRLQDLAQKQRALQRGYMEKLKKVFAGDDVQEAEFDLDQSEEVFDDLSELDLQRNEQLDTLVNNLNELAYIFKDLAALVVEQGALLDRIDYNLQESAHHSKAAVGELVKVLFTQAEKHQRTMRSTMCLLALILLIVVLVLALVLKHV